MSILKDMIFDLSEANGTPGEENEISELIEKYVSRFASTSHSRVNKNRIKILGCDYGQL